MESSRGGNDVFTIRLGFEIVGRGLEGFDIFEEFLDAWDSGRGSGFGSWGLINFVLQHVY